MKDKSGGGGGGGDGVDGSASPREFELTAGTAPIPASGFIPNDEIEREHDDSLNCRVYTWKDHRIPSVTSVLSSMSSFGWWVDNNTGEGDDYDARHIQWYSSRVGTLAHAAALQPLSKNADGSKRIIHGENERHAERDLRWLEGKKVDGDTPADVLYSVAKWQGLVGTRAGFRGVFGGDDTITPRHVHSHAHDDVSGFVNRFDYMRDILGITPETVLDVERRLFDPTLRVAGQCDLVYRARDGAVVMADLKTSGRLRDKYGYQSEAYSRAHPLKIDRIEIIRIKPRGGWGVHCPPGEDVSGVHDSSGWPADRETLWSGFCELSGDMVRKSEAARAERAEAGDGAGAASGMETD